MEEQKLSDYFNLKIEEVLSLSSTETNFQFKLFEKEMKNCNPGSVYAPAWRVTQCPTQELFILYRFKRLALNMEDESRVLNNLLNFIKRRI